MPKRMRFEFNTEHFKQIITSQYYSMLYYPAPVRLGSTTKVSLKKLVNSSHFKALRISKVDLLKKFKRANPKELTNY